MPRCVTISFAILLVTVFVLRGECENTSDASGSWGCGATILIWGVVSVAVVSDTGEVILIKELVPVVAMWN